MTEPAVRNFSFPLIVPDKIKDKATREFLRDLLHVLKDAIEVDYGAPGGYQPYDALNEFTQGSVLFADINGAPSEDNPNFFWDNDNKFLGVGLADPAAPVEIRRSISAGNDFTYDPSCAALWRYETGAFTDDSISTNNLTGSGPDEESVIIKEGTTSAAFVNPADNFGLITANMSVDFPYQPGDDPNTLEITIGTWFRPTILPASGNHKAIASRYNTTILQRGILLGIYNDAGTTGLSIRLGYAGFGAGGNAEQINEGNTTVVVDKWYWVGLSIKGSDKSYRIRVRDDEAGTTTEKTGNYTNELWVPTSTIGWMVGAHNACASAQYFDGYIDETVVFNDILTAAEMDTIWADTFGVLAEQLRLSYDGTNRVNFGVQSDGDFTMDSNKAGYNVDFTDGNIITTGIATIGGLGTGGYTDYDLKVGDTAGTPTYGIIQIGNGMIGRTSYNAGNIDLDGAIIFRNIGGPATGQVEFIWAESAGNTCRFALPKAGVGNATYNPRSMLIAGPAPADTDFVTVGYWQTNESIFDNLACDTSGSGSGADLGVQNDLEVERNIYVDHIKESTLGVGTTFSNKLIASGTAQIKRVLAGGVT